MKKRLRIRVDVRGLFYRGIDEGTKGLLDMMRYAGTGLLESNVRGFPEFIEYTTDDRTHEGAIARWASFGCKAEVVE